MHTVTVNERINRICFALPGMREVFRIGGIGALGKVLAFIETYGALGSQVVGGKILISK